MPNKSEESVGRHAVIHPKSIEMERVGLDVRPQFGEFWLSSPSLATGGDRRATGSRLRKILARLTLVGVSAFSSVAMFEVVGRLFFRGTADDTQYYQRLEDSVIRSQPILAHTRDGKKFDPKFGNIMSPNSSFTNRSGSGLKYVRRANSLGFRTREIEPRLAAEYRVMLVGDSFFYGHWIEERETIAVQIERMARSDQDVKRPLRVYNFAHPGFCTVQELLVAQTFAAELQPDAIILGFFAANDVIPNALTTIDDECHFAPVPERVSRFRNELRAQLGPLRHSLIFRLASLTTAYGNLLVYRIGAQPWVLEQNLKVLEQFQSFCRDHSYRFDVVFEHTTDSLSDWRNKLYRTEDVYRPLEELCNRAGISALDMRQKLIEDDDWQKYIIKGDGHYTAVGALKVAETVYRQLIRPEIVHEPSPGRKKSGVGLHPGGGVSSRAALVTGRSDRGITE